MAEPTRTTANAQPRGSRPDLLFVPDKEDGFVYRWINCSPTQQGDHNAYLAQWEGWEPAPMDASKLPSNSLTRLGQESSTPGGSTAHRRGDLVLCRMRKEAYERFEEQASENRRRAETTIDTMVLQADDNAKRRLRETHGQNARVPKGGLVFREEVGDPS